MQADEALNHEETMSPMQKALRLDRVLVRRLPTGIRENAAGAEKLHPKLYEHRGDGLSCRRRHRHDSAPSLKQILS